jgi:3-oxoacyl-[acyl-carrier-protein] synthase-1
MRVMTYKHNDDPEKGSKPMGAGASGFVPGSGAGALVLESLESALERKAIIYAEVLGGEVNSGGQRQGGTLTAPNAKAVQRCIKKAIQNSGLEANAVEVINGHLTATSKDGLEIENWTKALDRNGSDFPYINSTKSMIGHCLAAAGAIECVASVIQLKSQFIAPNINCKDLHPEIEGLIASKCIPTQKIDLDFNVIAKASFGFGDVNACVLFKKFES